MGDAGHWNAHRRYPRHNCGLALIAAINSNASSISGNSDVGANPCSAGTSRARASASRLRAQLALSTNQSVHRPKKPQLASSLTDMDKLEDAGLLGTASRDQPGRAGLALGSATGEAPPDKGEPSCRPRRRTWPRRGRARGGCGLAGSREAKTLRARRAPAVGWPVVTAIMMKTTGPQRSPRSGRRAAGAAPCWLSSLVKHQYGV